MASPVPAKSQPLHNFDLPRTLKWNKDGNSTTNHHRRRSIKSPSRRPNNPSPARHSPLRDSISAAHRESPLRDSADNSATRCDSVTRSPSRGDSVIEYRRNHHHHHSKNPGFVNSVKAERVSLKSEKKPKDSAEIKKSSKILIKIACKNSCNDIQEEENQKEEPSCEGNHTEEVKTESNNNDGVDEEAKTWNLRPRKPIRKSLNVNGGGIAVKNNNGSGSAMADKGGKAQSPPKNVNNISGENEGCGVEKEKRKLSVAISLTKEEIEEDIYSFTGLKPARRPKKRPRNIQKQVDFVFPGLWLVSITPDSYKVSENSMKG